MPHYADIRHSPYSPEQLYALVLDIEHYPEFLPWCRAARITQRTPEYFIGELIISFSHLTERYSSKVVGIPSADGAPAQIDVNLVNGPFHHLTNHWVFVPNREKGGTDIHFEVDFKFKYALLDKLIGGLFHKAVEKMSAAFIARADALYKISV